jgi:hypothetical protein
MNWVQVTKSSNYTRLDLLFFWSSRNLRKLKVFKRDQKTQEWENIKLGFFDHDIDMI